MQQVLNVKQKRGLPSLTQLRQLPRYLSSRERKISLFALLIALAAAATLAGQFVFAKLERVPAVGGEYTEGMVGYPHYINPLYAQANEVDATLTRLIFAGLMRLDPQEGLVPDIAESYTISPDEKGYTFILREGALWHDGEPVTSADVLYTFSAMQNPEYGSPLAGTLAGITITTNDPRTVSFTLPEPYAPFLTLMTTGILPAHLWENVSPANAQLTQLNLKPIGNGPYVFDKLVKDSRGTLRSITLTRNPDYYREAPKVGKLTFKFFTSSPELVEGMRNHTVEGTAMLPASELTSFVNDRAFAVNEAASRQFIAAFFNLKSTNTAVSDGAVRKALQQATDRSAVLQSLPAHTGQIMSNALMEGLPGFDSNQTVPSSDQAAAAAELDAAGWTFSEGATLRTKEGKNLQFAITTLDTPELVTVANTLAQQWQALGAEVSVISVDSTAFESTVLKERTYDVLVAGAQYGAFPDPYPFWHSSQAPHPGLNVSQLITKAADEAIATIRATADVNARATSFGALATAINETTAAIFLYQSFAPVVLPPSLKNVDIPLISSPGDRFSDVNEWHLKTRPVLKK